MVCFKTGEATPTPPSCPRASRCRADGGSGSSADNSAGVATLAADACATRGLEVAEASDPQSPLTLGIGAGPDEDAASIRELLGDVGVDALIVRYARPSGR